MVSIEKLDFENNIIQFSKDVIIKTVSTHGDNEFLITFAIKKSISDGKRSSSKINFESETIPEVNDIIKYLETKMNYRHDNAELQQHFLGRVLNSREERALYYKLRNLVNKAKDQLAERNEGQWIDVDTRSIDTGSVKIVELTSHFDEPEKDNDK